MPFSLSQIRLSSPVTVLPGIGPAKAQILARLNIFYLRDLLFHFPRRYDDFSTITPIGQLSPGKPLTVRGRIKSVTVKPGFQGKRRLTRIFVTIVDDSGELDVIWYNLKFLIPQLHHNRELYVAGMVEPNVTQNPRSSSPSAAPFRMRSPVMEFINQNDPTHTARITPIYAETHGISSRFLRYQVKQILPLIQTIPEYLPEEIRTKHHLIGIHEALRSVHFPDSTQNLAIAQARLRFDELFFLQLAALVRRAARSHRAAYQIPIDPHVISQITHQAGFSLTNAQTQALSEIFADLSQKQPMNRLLQGDVGSGKSIVAAAAALQALTANLKVLYLAPTEVLARQQHQAFSELLNSYPVHLLVGATPSHKKQKINQELSEKAPVCVIGTHALLQDHIVTNKCGLVIIDEQHRFGVAQRQSLQNVNLSDEMPHLLSMTATPIPRTLNLTVYGDLDVSTLNELPPGRQPIQTSVVSSHDYDRVIIHVLSELHAGRQGYVIAPLVEDSVKLQAKSAKAVFRDMQHLFPDIAVGLLHGQMSSADKEATLRSFSAGAIQLLVATAVVEVGVNVPNATIMLIEGAERFGLAQLHQFRGRIGRGEHQSFCYLFPTHNDSNDNLDNPRLNILAQTNDGFVIAEKDLELRGPGEIYGLAQSGFGHLQVASLLDYAAIKKARASAQALLKQDPSLDEYPILKAKVAQKNTITHFE